MGERPQELSHLSEGCAKPTGGFLLRRFKPSHALPTDLTRAITASPPTKHPAENEAGNQPSEHAGDEQKGGSHQAAALVYSDCTNAVAVLSLNEGRPQ